MMEKAILDKLLEQEMLIKELKEENFVLKSQLNVEQQYDLMKQSLDDKQNAIDKAIEYIEEECYGFNLVDDIRRDEAFKEILKILKGEDK